jgi:hypothetical protein
MGMDCKNIGDDTNFYGKNLMHRAETLISCYRSLNWIKKCDHGREIISCSANDVFDNVDIKDAIKDIKNLKEKNREEWVEKIFKNKNR